jgi:hypothetical protein
METVNRDRVRRGWRSRWAAIGAAVAVSLGAGGFFIAEAASGPESNMVMIDPVRIMDTRDPVNVGLPGPFVSPIAQKLQVTGSVPTTSGAAQTVVPAGATGVLLNVTAVGASADGFISIRPGDAAGPPATSSLNVTAGVTVPNAVQVALPTTGKIDITWDALGVAGPTTDILIDVVAYTLKADLGEIVMSHGAGAFGNPAAAVQVYGQSYANTTGSGFGNMPLTGPGQLDGVKYGLKSIEYCMDIVTAGPIVNSVTVSGSSELNSAVVEVVDPTDRTADGCFSLIVNDPNSRSFMIAWEFSGAAGDLRIMSVTSTWAPVSTIPAPLVLPAPSDASTGNGS